MLQETLLPLGSRFNRTSGGRLMSKYTALDRLNDMRERQAFGYLEEPP